MRVFRSLDAAAGAGPSAVTIGNFDGVHLGHRALLHAVSDLAHKRDWRATVLTFDPHPAQVLTPDRAPRMLTTIEQRLALLAGQGIHRTVVVPFDREFSQRSPEDFARHLLAGTLHARAVFVGYNFRFGHKAAGDTTLLAALGERFGFSVHVVDGVRFRGCPVSSSEVRRLLGAGEVARAARYLARPYALEGAVVAGQGIGRASTVPTLNLAAGASVTPATGVYVTRVDCLETSRTWPAVTNVGYRPTFHGAGLTIESFLLTGLDAQATPRHIRVSFLHRLREERTFPGAAELKAQILKDAARATTFHRRLRRFVAAE
ncbi:MAG: bifunctional riboflavin kinase/FAD synthetase [Acidobacteria bacterium]|nr:bifunctional riboflavin kinase/FAD synthetase [Acidobacteriota bacterium]